MGEVTRHTTNLIAGAFFFAMRACEFVQTSRRGKTKKIEARDVTFRDRNKREIAKWPRVDQRDVEFVSICFRDQKNGKRLDVRTHARSGHRTLCPVRLWVKVVNRVTLHSDSEVTPVCQISVDGEDLLVSASTVTRTLKSLRQLMGDNHPQLKANLLGTRSIRSGAAMALFLHNHHPERIKILGRWSSDAFLIYIRPQVIEWTNLMATDMAKTEREDLFDGLPPSTHPGVMPSLVSPTP